MARQQSWLPFPKVVPDIFLHVLPIVTTSQTGIGLLPPPQTFLITVHSGHMFNTQ
jgi:hypothetical protein